MSKDFRQSKYLNESGSKQGNWYINRLVYFQFYEYPKFKQHRLVSLMMSIACYFLTLEFLSNHFFLALVSVYFCYFFLLTFIILKRRVCRLKGYFFYPKRIINFFKAREVEVDLDDFDSIATLEKK